MNERFRDLVEALEGKYRELLAMQPKIAQEVPNNTPVGGIYLFSEGTHHLYAGRTKRSLAVRIRNHFNAAPDCPFAWLLAWEATGKRPSYTQEGSRKALLADPIFRAEYERAKNRIRPMHISGSTNPIPFDRRSLRSTLRSQPALGTTTSTHSDDGRAPVLREGQAPNFTLQRTGGSRCSLLAAERERSPAELPLADRQRRADSVGT